MRVSVFLLLAGLFFTACNNEIFVDKLSVSVSQATLQGDGDSITIDVTGTDWWAMALTPADADVHSTYLSGRLYDADGVEVGYGNLCGACGKLSVTYIDNVYNFSHDISLIRTDDHALKVVLGKNHLTDENFDITIRVADCFSAVQDIRLTQLPGSGYVFGSMTYMP